MIASYRVSVLCSEDISGMQGLRSMRLAKARPLEGQSCQVDDGLQAVVNRSQLTGSEFGSAAVLDVIKRV